MLFSLFTSTETSFLKFALKEPYFQITTAQVFRIIQFLNWPRFYRLLHFHDGKHGQYSFQNCVQNLIMPKEMIMLSLMLQMQYNYAQTYAGIRDADEMLVPGVCVGVRACIQTAVKFRK